MDPTPTEGERSPRDESGRFTKPADVVNAARSWGLSEEEIKESSTKELRQQIRAYQHDQVLGRILESVSRSSQQAPAAPSAPAAPAFPELDENIAPEITTAIRKLHAEFQQKTAALEQQNAALQQHIASQRANDQYAALDDAFSKLGDKYASHLGQGRHHQLSSAVITERNRVLQTANMIPGDAPLHEKIDRAAAFLYGEAAPAKTYGVADDQKLWRQGVLARPTHRNGASEPHGRFRAEQAVDAKLKQFAEEARSQARRDDDDDFFLKG